ncbi:HNH endonuclease [Sphingomonas taxi]|uniref:HNH endonuclease n=1 Tax=Sphingomonas taxi TaxID=1549858 RepID=UPI0012E02953|nr:hypothetical protein [Sphingomonas taxi]
MPDLVLATVSGTVLNARVEQDDRGIVLHSRSGKGRNRDYRQALEIILTRLDAAAIPYEVFLDSRPAQQQPLARRRLSVSETGLVADRFNELVRAMNAGSSSNGASRRVLITAPNVSPRTFAAVVEGRPEDQDGRLSIVQLKLVTPEHVDKAVQYLLDGHDVPNFAPSRDFDLVAPNGSRLAPKKVFGLALQAATGIEARPTHFTAGIGTPCFQILEAAGYPIVRKDEVVPGRGVEAVDPDLAIAEGRPRLVAHLRRERKPALASAKRRAMVEQLGYLRCERCGIVPSAALGPNGDAVIEVHHATIQLAEMASGHVTRLSDLMCLCANCHRIVHRELAG